ncbi:MAG: type II secretion system protein [Phycisphaerales bacterium]|nr:type II secretion system protein [Phycisphaerales bacterium]
MMIFRDGQFGSGRRRRAFSLLELLVVVAIITLLAALLLVAVNKARGTARRASTQTLMNSMSQSMQRFKEDHGYFPPVLDTDRDLFYPYDASDPSLTTETVNAWYSITSPAEYLVGYGHHYQDGYGKVPGASGATDWAEETPALGIRSPGADGVWNATRYGVGELRKRMLYAGTSQGSETAPYEFDSGQVYGPYLELSNDRLLGGLLVVGTMQTVVFPGEAGYTADLPKVIVDDWGTPIRYYRRPYPSTFGAPATSLGETIRFSDRDNDGLHDPVGLDAVIALRPFTFAQGKAVDSRNTGSAMFADADGDSSTTIELRSAEFAFLSAGADMRIVDDRRLDDFNKDNLVEVSK